MATITKTISNGPGWSVEIEYDSISRRITRLRGINDTDFPLYVNAARINNGLAYDHIVPSNTNQFINIPTTAANRLQLTVTASGKLDGVEYRIWQ